MNCFWKNTFKPLAGNESSLITEILCYLGILCLSVFGIKSLLSGSELYGYSLLAFALSIAASLKQINDSHGHDVGDAKYTCTRRIHIGRASTQKNSDMSLHA
jgi:hypothetical protein